MKMKKITLELDKWLYDELQEAFQIRSSSVETELRKWLKQCHQKMALAKKQEEVSNAANKPPLSFLRVIDGGKMRCVQMDGVDTAGVAACLTQYLDKAPSIPPTSFENMFTSPKPIAEDEFMARTFELLGDSQQVEGIFDVDLNAGTFSTLDVDRGWQTFPVSTICGISRSLEERSITDKARLAAAFRDLPYSKQTVKPDRLSLLSGECPIRAEDITPHRFLVEDDGIITFIVDVEADEREVFGTELFTDQDSYFVFYAVYNTDTQQVSDMLEISLMRPAETVEFVCPLPPDTVEGLRTKLDECCIAWSGKHLDELEAPPETEYRMGSMLY